jgi:tetraacyldisaccharide 4'-kinase
VNLDGLLQAVWYRRSPLWLFLLLIPLSALFALVVWLRRGAYGRGFFSSVRVSVPVIVIGNITVGGTGKTPFVIWLTQWLQAKGWRVGIVIRGYGGQSTRWPREVQVDTPYTQVGDEAVLLAQRTGAIVVAGPDRAAAARRAVDLGADFVLSDDGLQHYRLARDVEIAVVDAARLLGNGWLLPAGPLREPRSRLTTVDLIVRTQRARAADVHDQRTNSPSLEPTSAPLGSGDRAGPPNLTAIARIAEAVSLTGDRRRALESFRGGRVHAIAGIGNPEAFFDSLRALGLHVDGRALPDHAAATRADITFPDDEPVLMTQKDAVKCRHLADERHWAVPLDVELSEADAAVVERLIRQLLQLPRTGNAPRY